VRETERKANAESLEIAGLPEPLRQAALDAVNSWVYRPTVLDGSAVEMETTINVIFKVERPQGQHESGSTVHVTVEAFQRVRE
jgi:hypothetical protein